MTVNVRIGALIRMPRLAHPIDSKRVHFCAGRTIHFGARFLVCQALGTVDTGGLGDESLLPVERRCGASLGRNLRRPKQFLAGVRFEILREFLLFTEFRAREVR